MTGALPRVGPEAFDGQRLLRPGVVVVAFLADWCPFCRAFEPELAALAGEHGLTALDADVTEDDSPLWERFRLNVVPTVVVYRDGAAVFRADGRRMRGLGSSDLRRIAAAAGAA
jgi:thioredoxin 1